MNEVTRYYLTKNGKYYCENGMPNECLFEARSWKTIELAKEWKEKYYFDQYEIVGVKLIHQFI